MDVEQVKNCTKMAIIHLSEKLKSTTPQLSLLHDICKEFIKNDENNIFEFLNHDVECVCIHDEKNNSTHNHSTMVNNTIEFDCRKRKK